MVTQVTSLGRNGVSDWLIQRVSAVVLAVYTLFLVGYLLFQDVGYAQWRALFDQTWMQIFTLLALLSTCAHAWIGMWTVGTDYLREHTIGRSASAWRLLYEVVCSLVLFGYLIWGVLILWA